MDFPQDYPLPKDDPSRPLKWPNLLEGENFEFTSLRTDLVKFADCNYNCCAWALSRTDKWLDMYEGFLEELELDEKNLDHSAEGYANDVYAKYGFEICKDGALEEGFYKIVLYSDGRCFTHVARQLPDGRWTSKLGCLEDIMHHQVEDLTGTFYGQPTIYMRKAGQAAPETAPQ